MRVQMISHASLLCETEDARILMDPWIIGPANFRSWWHLPEVEQEPSRLPAADYIYISHLHGDHFHAPTLEALDRRATVLVPRLYHNRMVRRLRRLGYTRIRELPHLKQVALTSSTSVCCAQAGNDSLLAVADSTASMLNVNDALQGNSPLVTVPLLRNLASHYPFDIAFLAFGTAGAFPKCYQFEDPREAMDPWVKEKAMLNNFVRGAAEIRARAVVPFAGGFALLADRLLWMNEAKTTPLDAIEALRASDPDVNGFEMNPGDFWDNRAGMTRIHPGVDWKLRLAIIRQMREARAEELRRIDREERQGPPDLYDLFCFRLRQNLKAFPFLRSRMSCAVLFEVEGEPGGLWEVDLRDSPVRFRQGDSGDWLIRVTIPSAILAEVLTEPDGLETLGISYKFNIYMRKGARSKETLLNRLLHTPSPIWLAKLLVSPRFAEFVLRRRGEFTELVRSKLLATA